MSTYCLTVAVSNRKELFLGELVKGCRLPEEGLVRCLEVLGSLGSAHESTSHRNSKPKWQTCLRICPILSARACEQKQHHKLLVIKHWGIDWSVRLVHIKLGRWWCEICRAPSCVVRHLACEGGWSWFLRMRKGQYLRHRVPTINPQNWRSQ